MSVRAGLLVGLLSLALAACGSQSQSTSGGPSTGPYPALRPDIGQIVNRGGMVLESPEIVTVTWTTDANEASLEEFGDKLGASSYWKEVLADYGVGPATSGASRHVRVSTALPAAMEVMDLETWLGQELQNPAGGWPAWDAQTLYVLYVPTTTHLTSGGVDVCGSDAAQHSEIMVANHAVTYVFVDESCNGKLSVLDGATRAASHGIIEDVTDPYPYSGAAFAGFDSAHLAWSLLEGDENEVGDICKTYSDAVFTGPSDLPYALQRMWSNKSGGAGHSPCVPQSAEPYFNATPVGQETLDVVVGSAQMPVSALGYRIPVGSSKTFDVAYYSDAPTGLWNLTAFEGNGVTAPSASHLTLAVAHGTGANGQRDQVTVKVDSAPAAGNAILLTLVSSAQGHTTHYFPVLVGAY